MICELFIQNIAVIEKLRIDFQNGMSVLTGETGAGKSIIIDSINMILGNKADKSLIRHGEEKALVCAVFDVSEKLQKELLERGIECEENKLYISRTMSVEGKNICRINEITSPLSVLRDISPLLINIHGQHDNQALLSPSKHIKFLDAFAQNSELICEYSALYAKLKEAKKQLSELLCNDDERLRRADLLEYQVNEIESAELKPNEEQELIEQRDIIANAERITNGVLKAKEALYTGDTSAYNSLYNAVSALEKITGIDGRIDKAFGTLSEMMYSVQDISYEISDFAGNAEFDEKALDDIEERLDVYSKLKRKYGNTYEEIQKFYESASEELSKLQNIDENIEICKEKIEKITGELTHLSEKLTKARKKSAKILEERIEKSLSELNMEQARFSVRVEKTDDFTPDGCDKVEFLISPNAGDTLKPLAKIASGGELSRVMLAIKSILAECDDVETLIFDEIDTGVSGSAAQKIADKLAHISKLRQVICITHLPQLASGADNHFYIEKTTENKKTKTSVHLLEGEERIEEIARITGGELTEISKEHARELIKKANERKCK